MAYTLSRIDRKSRTYELSATVLAEAAAIPPELTGVDVALLPPRSAPTAATVWFPATYADGAFTVLLAGPDADSTGALVVPASADLWMRIADSPEVDAEKLERITLLGGGAVLQAPTGVPIIQGTGAGGALSGSYPNPGLNETTVDTVVAGKVGATGSATDVALRANYGRVYTPEAYGAKGDGTTDDTAAFNAMFAAMLAAKGGTAALAPATYRINGQIALPWTADGTGAPVGTSMRLIGSGQQANGRGSGLPLTTKGGTVLDLRYTGGGTSQAKILSVGFGHVEIAGITFTDGGTSSNPFLKSTNTTVHLHDLAFVGNPSKSLETCDQDAIVLGGTNLPVGGDFDTTSNGPYQGYGSRVEHIWFNRIRTGLRLGAFANAVTADDLTFWQQCGGTGASAVVIDPADAVGQNVMGLALSNVLVEAAGYAHAVSARKLDRSVISNVGAYDYSGNASWLSPIHLDACHNLLVLPGFFNMAGGENYITAASGDWRDQATFLSVGAGWNPNAPHIVFSAIVDAWTGLNVRNSGGGGGTSLLFARPADAATGPQAGFANFGRTWQVDDSGNNMFIDSGTGGSFVDIRAWSVRVQNQTGAQSGIELMGGSSYKGAIKTGQGATGARPAAATVGAGGQWFDTTLGKPIWVNSAATGWVDATGTAV